MIHVDRSAVSPPDRLVSQDGQGIEETKAALTFYETTANLKKKFNFKAYRHPDVKDLLIKLFHAKCAYCEGSVSGGHDGDVEHFRPKGAIEIHGVSSKPGYYWLAAHWENLFLSCQHCNQKRKHRIETGGVLTAGKASKFPVAAEANRVTHQDLPDLVDANDELDLGQLGTVCQDELRLLLDPCLDDPSSSLLFLDDGMIAATFDAGGNPDPKGDASIKTFGLHRPQLVNDRATELVKIKDQLEMVRTLAERLEQHPNDAFIRQILETSLRHLETHCHPKQRFSGMARQVVDRFLDDLFG